MSAEKLGFGTEIHELKLGASFTNPRNTGFHTVRYDFKPASVDVNKSATIDVGNNNQITVNVPHLDGAGTSQTVFKGSQKQYQKECVLIIDKITGEITLEKLTSNIQVKKTRSESTHKPVNVLPLEKSNCNTLSSFEVNSSKSSKVNSRNRKDRNITNLIPKHSPLQVSPARSSPGYSKSPKREHVIHKSPSASPVTQNTLASLPMIGVDDFSSSLTHSTVNIEKSPMYNDNTTQQANTNVDTVGVLSDSSSSSESSDDSANDSSDSDSEHNVTTVMRNGTSAVPNQQSQTAVKRKDSNSSYSGSDEDKAKSHISGINKPSTINRELTVPDSLLTEDLCLSESGSDSD